MLWPDRGKDTFVVCSMTSMIPLQQGETYTFPEGTGKIIGGLSFQAQDAHLPQFDLVRSELELYQKKSWNKIKHLYGGTQRLALLLIKK